MNWSISLEIVYTRLRSDIVFIVFMEFFYHLYYVNIIKRIFNDYKRYFTWWKANLISRKRNFSVSISEIVVINDLQKKNVTNSYARIHFFSFSFSSVLNPKDKKFPITITSETELVEIFLYSKHRISTVIIYRIDCSASSLSTDDKVLSYTILWNSKYQQFLRKIFGFILN